MYGGFAKAVMIRVRKMAGSRHGLLVIKLFDNEPAKYTIIVTAILSTS